jgi:hypothetical protein
MSTMVALDSMVNEETGRLTWAERGISLMDESAVRRRAEGLATGRASAAQLVQLRAEAGMSSGLRTAPTRHRAAVAQVVPATVLGLPELPRSAPARPAARE